MGNVHSPGGKHGLLYDVTTTGTSGRSVKLSMLYRVLCCQNIGVVSSAVFFVAAEHKAAASPVGLSFRTTLLDSFDVLHCWGWCQTVLHFELQSLGLSILHDSGNIPTTDIGAIVKACVSILGCTVISGAAPTIGLLPTVVSAVPTWLRFETAVLLRQSSHCLAQ